MPEPKSSPRSHYPSNSDKSRKEAVKVTVEKTEETEGTESTKGTSRKQEKIISGEVVQRKKSIGRKLTEAFTGDDVHNVGHYILLDVLLPAAKTMISDAVSQGIERLMFGDMRPRHSTGLRTNYTSYNRMYTGGARRDEPRQITQRTSRSSSPSFNEIVLATRGDAEQVLDRLGELIQNYDVASVSDLYDMVGITGSYTDEKWGWADIRDARVHRVRDGYLLDLPRAEPID